MEDVSVKTARVAEELKKKEDNTIKLSTGVVLRCMQAPPLMLIRVMAAFPRPKPPVWHDPKMGRDMENPDDPDYIDRLKAWSMDQSNAMLNALIIFGTELVSKPKDIPSYKDDAWLEKYTLLGMEMKPDNQSWRYLTWVTTFAAVTAEDFNMIKEAVGRLSGVPEKDVQAAETFPGSDQTPG